VRSDGGADWSRTCSDMLWRSATGIAASTMDDIRSTLVANP
jgi:hypothetical protein